jgi:beta-N-acetylhexosaminidase
MLPLISSLQNTELNDNERYLFQHHKIWGLILFKRNIASILQLKSLIADIRGLQPHINIMIDEEGGRITRLDNIYPKSLPSNYELGNLLSQDIEAGYQAICKNYQIIAQRLNEFSINMVCAPLCDLLHHNTHGIIGDRAFSSNPEIVIKASKIAADTLLKNQISPIIKHIPGHGRAISDSHLSLPKINTEITILEKTDFHIFKNLAHYPFAMTAHITYQALDPDLPVTLSKKAIFYIKNILGYKGKIISDDINMKALSKYSISEITSLAYKAKCDYILHCNGNFSETSQIIDTLTTIHNE